MFKERERECVCVCNGNELSRYTEMGYVLFFDMIENYPIPWMDGSIKRPARARRAKRI